MWGGGKYNCNAITELRHPCSPQQSPASSHNTETEVSLESGHAPLHRDGMLWQI